MKGGFLVWEENLPACSHWYGVEIFGETGIVVNIAGVAEW